jgi:hypothetical protein
MNELYLSKEGPPSIRAIYLRIKNVKNYLHAAKFAEFVLVSFWPQEYSKEQTLTLSLYKFLG